MKSKKSNFSHFHLLKIASGILYPGFSPCLLCKHSDIDRCYQGPHPVFHQAAQILGPKLNWFIWINSMPLPKPWGQCFSILRIGRIFSDITQYILLVICLLLHGNAEHGHGKIKNKEFFNNIYFSFYMKVKGHLWINLGWFCLFSHLRIQAERISHV